MTVFVFIKMKAVSSSKMIVSIYESTRWQPSRPTLIYFWVTTPCKSESHISFSIFKVKWLDNGPVNTYNTDQCKLLHLIHQSIANEKWKWGWKKGEKRKIWTRSEENGGALQIDVSGTGVNIRTCRPSKVQVSYLLLQNIFKVELSWFFIIPGILLLPLSQNM